MTYPENDEIVYYIDSDDGEISDTLYFANNKDDINLFEHGLYFNTQEEAEQHLKECKLLFKLKQWAKEKNGGWELDWEDDSQEKVFIHCFKNLKENIELTYKRTWNINKFTKLPYFKTYEIAQECIDLFGDEIKEVLC